MKNAASAILKKYGLQDKLKELAEKFGSETILVSLADLYAEQKNWIKARDSYKAAWEKDKSKSILAFMIAKMEENIGDKTQASKWKDLASWGPLGNEQVRLDFAYALGKRNYVDDALVQFDLVSKTGSLVLIAWALLLVR